MAIVVGQTILGADTERPGALQSVRSQISPGNLFLSVAAIRIPGDGVNPCHPVQSNAQREQEFDIEPSTSITTYCHGGFATGKQDARRGKRLPTQSDLADNPGHD